MAQGIEDVGLSKDNLRIPKVYSEIFLENYRYFILSSGRISGKTSCLVGAWWVTVNKYPDKDIVILQATATEIKDSIINEIRKFIENSGLDNEFTFTDTKKTIERKGQKGTTYFYPITDSKGGQRSRGIATKNQVALVLYEEAQKNKDANVLEQSVITFIRQLGAYAKLIIVGNNETVGHWFVDYVAEKRLSPEWCYIYSNCYDIWELLNEQTRNYIETKKRTDEIEFRRVFLGDINASSSDVVFPQFDKDKHYKLRGDIPTKYIQMLFIGVDHATANDTFCAVPVAVLDDGTAEVLEVCYDDPEEENRTLAPTEQCEILEDFLAFLDENYGIADNKIPTVISIDGAATPFINQLMHTKRTSKRKKFWSSIKIKGFTLKHKDINLGIIKNALAYNLLILLNEGVYNWQGKPNKHRLMKEIQAQRYNKVHKLDDKIKNDLCDGLEYGLVPYFSNCYNLSYPARMMKYAKENGFNDVVQGAKMRNKKYGGSYGK